MRVSFRALAPGKPLTTPLHAAPLLSLAETFRDKRILLAMLGWTVLNILLAWGGAA